ncbi:MAG TPA: AraC family transcriptional regulator [Steroidobacteraceae bacterium]
MNTPRSRDVYLDRMHRVTAYIDQHLDQYLDLETLAEVAHFSPFHFHRLFSALTGETLGAYLRRRRCEVAATRLLAQPRLSVLQIALGVGFGSAEAFTHAFGARFGCSPTTWRLQQAPERAAIGNPDQMNSKPDQMQQDKAMKNGVPTKTEAPMKVQIVERKATPIAYLRRVGPYGQPIGAFWQTQVYPWMVANGLMGQPRYAISHDDPRVTAPEQCRYDAGCEIPAGALARGNAHRTTIPGGQYAALDFKGVVADFEPAWNALLRDWLPSSGLQLDGRPMFEYYPTDSSFDPVTGILDCQLCVPVMPL